MLASAAASRSTAEATNQRPWIPTKPTPQIFSATVPARIARQIDAADRHPVGGTSAAENPILNPARANRPELPVQQGPAFACSILADPMVFPLAWDEIAGITNPQPSRNPVVAQRAGGEQGKVVASTVEIIRYVAMLGERSIVPLYQRLDDPFNAPKIAIGLSRLGDAEAHVTRNRVMDNDILQGVRDDSRLARQLGQARPPATGIRPRCMQAIGGQVAPPLCRVS